MALNRSEQYAFHSLHLPDGSASGEFRVKVAQAASPNENSNLVVARTNSVEERSQRASCLIGKHVSSLIAGCYASADGRSERNRPDLNLARRGDPCPRLRTHPERTRDLAL